MKVLIAANSNGLIHYLAGKYPGAVGWMMSPQTKFMEPRHWLPYAVDNGKYAAWATKQDWKFEDFTKLLDRCRLSKFKPEWIVVPDQIGCVHSTQSLWYLHEMELRKYEWPLAYVVQDGADESRVPKAADLVFVGGTTEWKWRNVKRFASSFPRVHVGRVNAIEKIEYCEQIGVESCDGSGFFREGENDLRSIRLQEFLSGHRRHKEQLQLA